MNKHFIAECPCAKWRDTGMVLLLCLIFLTALSLIGLSASADSILQNQILANLKETQRAKQSALATLSWAEQWLLGLDSPAPTVCDESCDGLRLFGPDQLPDQPASEMLTWWSGHGHLPGIDPLSSQHSTKKKEKTEDNHKRSFWVIQVIYVIPPSEDPASELRVWYRLLARGGGNTEVAISVVESIVVRTWPATHSDGVSDDNVLDVCSASSPIQQCGRVGWRELL